LMVLPASQNDGTEAEATDALGDALSRLVILPRVLHPRPQQVERQPFRSGLPFSAVCVRRLLSARCSPPGRLHATSVKRARCHAARTKDQRGSLTTPARITSCSALIEAPARVEAGVSRRFRRSSSPGKRGRRGREIVSEWTLEMG